MAAAKALGQVAEALGVLGADLAPRLASRSSAGYLLVVLVFIVVRIVQSAA